jgi:hypothetical protein
VLDEAVGNTDAMHLGRDSRRGEALAHRAAGATRDRVLLDRHDALVRRGERANRVLVQRLDEAHVDQRGVEALGDVAARCEHRSKCQQQQARPALAPDLGLAERHGGHLVLDARARAGPARVANGRGTV